jgi:hypothetical protein
MDRPTLPAAILDNGCPLSVIGSLIGRQRMSLRASQSIRVQDVQQILVTFFLVQQILDWKSHHTIYYNSCVLDSPYTFDVK